MIMYRAIAAPGERRGAQYHARRRRPAPHSGAPVDHPRFLSFRFMLAVSHCTVHGRPGDVGMAGAVTVLPPAPTDYRRANSS
jgi:hypothetical protein